MPHEKKAAIDDLLKQIMAMRVVIHNPNGQTNWDDKLGNGMVGNFANGYHTKFDTRQDYLTAGTKIYVALEKKTKPPKWVVKTSEKPSEPVTHGLNCQGCTGLLAYMLSLKQIEFQIIYFGVAVHVDGHVLLKLPSKDEHYYLDYWMARCRSNLESQILPEALGLWDDYDKILSEKMVKIKAKKLTGTVIT
jgi:hypothetical protein